MAAYAALVSLMYIIEQIEHHPRPPISLDRTLVESLIEKTTFLQEFLEGYSMPLGFNNEADPLETRIADAAHAAEDIIESHIVDQIHVGSMNSGKRISCIYFHESLQKVIQEMNSIKKEAMEIKEKKGAQPQLWRNSTPPGSSRSADSTRKDAMVGFDDVFLDVMDKLTNGQLNRQTIAIVGMGGIGKTTLARNVYQDPVVEGHFDLLSWVTVSQNYRMREILSELLQVGMGGLSEEDEYELGDRLHQRLSGRRYLIVLDDIWDIEVWDRLRMFFPDYINGSRIVITTRISNFQVSNSYLIEMRSLDEDNSWILFSNVVFPEEGCPLELEGIGKKIVEYCRGLPLSIVVVGGLLKKSEQRQEYWRYIAENLYSVVNSDDNNRCLRILQMSYNHLPIYLKPCFLYMGVFPEERRIRVSELIKLWAAEGFLKPSRGKNLDETAHEFLKELINRNMVLVQMLSRTGNIKYCNVHDLLRDLILREAQKEKFYNVVTQDSLDISQGTSAQRRIIIPRGTSRSNVLGALQSTSLARSLMSESEEVVPLRNFRLLRILPCSDFHFTYFLEDVFQLVNSRYLSLNARWRPEFPSSANLLWNLHTLIVQFPETGSFDIWSMPRLSHFEFVVGIHLLDPVGGRNGIVLRNLQTLSMIINFKCCDEVVKRIPNVKKLEISYSDEFEEAHLDNLRRLCKLESFYCRARSGAGVSNLNNLTFPRSLKKLAMEVQHVHYWEGMLGEIGSLPLLEKLKIIGGSFRGREWETAEGGFRSLKFMHIRDCRDLERWTTESSHFPRLEHLVLYELKDLKEIPLEIGDMPTLKSIQLEYCSSSIVVSAKKILDEQEESYGEVGFQVRVLITDPRQTQQLQGLATPNFQFI